VFQADTDPRSKKALIFLFFW